MKITARFDPTSANSGSFLATANGKFVAINDSNVNLDLAFANGFSDTLLAGARRRWGAQQPNAYVGGTAQSGLGGSAPNVSQVTIVTYTLSEPIPETYPSPVVRQTNIGNSVPLATAATSIANTGNAPATNVVTIQPSDAASPTITIDNSGNVTIKGDNAGVLTMLLQLLGGASPSVLLAAAGVLTTIAGNCTIAQHATVQGKLTVDGATTLNQTLSLIAGAINGMVISGPFTVTQAGTICAHGLGAIPLAVIPIADVGNSAATGPYGVNFGTMTSTDVTVYNQNPAGVRTWLLSIY